MLTVIIPMAGQGSRFSAQGYHEPKPLIQVAGKTLAERSISSLGLPNAHYVFITRSFDDPADNERLTEVFAKNCKTFTEVRVDTEHLGAAHSALYAEKYVDQDSELIITNCDQAMIWDANDFLDSVRNENADGAIVLFQSESPQHSFAKLNGIKVVDIAEKNPISDHALVGIHYWKTAKDFFESARKLVAEYKDLGYQEPYISISYKYLLDQKYITSYHLTGDARYYSLGTPEDVNRYLNINDREFVDSDTIKHTATYEQPILVDSSPRHSIIKNVIISGPAESGEVSFDKVFLFNANEKGFFHGIADVVGQYLAIKKLVPDIVPVFIETDPGLSLENTASFMKDILRMGIVQLTVVPLSIKTIKINSIYVASPRDYQLFYKLFMNIIPELLTEETNPGNEEYIKQILYPIAEKLIQQVKPTANNIRKIFIHSSNKRMGDGTGIIDEKDSRFVNKTIYDEVVQEYQEAGYEIIDPEDMSLLEQIALVRSASDIVTPKSSNSIHSIYANPGTKFTMINLSTQNNFPHEITVKAFIEDAIFIDRSKNENA